MFMKSVPLFSIFYYSHKLLLLIFYNNNGKRSKRNDDFPVFGSPLLRDTSRITKRTLAVLYKLLNSRRKVYDAGRRRAKGGRIEFTLPPSQLTLRRKFEITSKVETRLKAILQGRSRIIRFLCVILSNDVVLRTTIASLKNLFMYFSFVFSVTS